MEILIKRLRKSGDGFSGIAKMKDELRKGNTLIYKGWEITARPKYTTKDNRIWITAKKYFSDRLEIIEDDMLIAIFNVIKSK